MPAAKTVQTARLATTSGRWCSAEWSVFFEADFEGTQGDPEVGQGGLELQVASEVFESGTGVGDDLGAKAIAFAFGQRLSVVDAGLGFERGTGLV